MKKVLTEIISNSRWSSPCFDSKLILEGRILSPVEAEAIGIGSALIASSIASREDLERLQSVSSEKDVNEDNVSDLFDALRNFDADKIIQMAEAQDKILVKCIRRASIDEGKTWSKISICMEENQQSVKAERLWVGMLGKDDRKNMIELCLTGHSKATEKIRGSL